MTILVKNKHTLQINEFKFKCCVGRNGSTKYKREGDKKTPKGSFQLEYLYFRKDRLEKPLTSLKCFEIKENMGWCNDPLSKNYNRLVKLPSHYSFEKLYRKENIYDIILVLNYNMHPIIRNKGSAIFIHISRKNYKKTEGCVALKKNDLLNIIQQIKKNTVVKIEHRK